MRNAVTIDQVWQAVQVDNGPRTLFLIAASLVALSIITIAVGGAVLKPRMIFGGLAAFLITAVFMFLTLVSYGDSLKEQDALAKISLQGILEKEVDGDIEVKDGEILPLAANQTAEVSLTDRTGNTYPCTIFTNDTTYTLVCDSAGQRTLIG